ncbi:MAG: Histone deacetylase-like amidohydrolase [Betaproteobacteria bacterium ADurb.Bin341]|nr:MAG: Histone deacetylase-like amidohydrolase [Betaproteobacteria bacterium ADurb.Bin341]
MGRYHPECPGRLEAIDGFLAKEGLDALLTRYEVPLAPIEALCRVHSRDYVDMVRAAAPHAGMVQLDADTAMNPHTWNAALRAAGAGLLAVDLVVRAEADNAFCAVRPPGHHALRGAAMGFCVFNNVAVAAAHTLAEHGLKRVAIIDFDVHHGNGTEEAFSGDARVLMCGIFQHPFYPYSGADSRADNMLNVPLARGAGSAEFRAVVEQKWLPRLERFKPQIVFFSAGFDAHRDDDIGGLALVEDDYAWCTGQIKALAARHAQGRIVSMLEGGYNLDALARCVAAHVRVLAGAA